MLRIPAGPKSIQKGSTLKTLLDREAINCLSDNLCYVHSSFNAKGFRKAALDGLEPLGLMARGKHIASALQLYLPEKYDEAIEILLSSLTPPNTATEDLGLGVFFYLPHTAFVAEYGMDKKHNNGNDPFDTSMNAQYELTKRFTAEFSIRQFLIKDQERTLQQLIAWTSDPDPHVRRLCSEGARPRLPWGNRIPSFIEDPTPLFQILETLKNDESLYVRRSVANNLGDIAKDHPDKVFEICEQWLVNADDKLKWVIRHALRHPAKKGDARALKIRKAAK